MWAVKLKFVVLYIAAGSVCHQRLMVMDGRLTRWVVRVMWTE